LDFPARPAVVCLGGVGLSHRHAAHRHSVAADGVGLISPAILILVQGCGSVSQFRSSERLFRFCTGTGNGNRNAGSNCSQKS